MTNWITTQREIRRRLHRRMQQVRADEVCEKMGRNWGGQDEKGATVQGWHIRRKDVDRRVLQRK